ncbi:hypothetical protein KYN89_08380 [Alteriqipengyuania sp. NZ-12B]|uniref:Peptidase M61 catalytic domain-containing protein n=1 Tax=Alteriqipengyuania abyssalis TaxID=2860200 RepID=A0ABS7PDC5_9SPHN|nr:hypothetical protein [Alteriqipengyuania abyssalis]MBY8337065.1 hypothetical protein [Alteriqipengyuania abyssalis]
MVRALVAALSILALAGCASLPPQPDASDRAAAQAGILSFGIQQPDRFDAITVRLDLPDSAAGSVLTFPDSWGPEENLSQSRGDIAFRGLERLPGEGEAYRVAPGGGWITYTVAQDYEGEPDWETHRLPGMRVRTAPSHAFLLGPTVLPAWSQGGVPLTLDLQSLPQRAAFSFAPGDCATGCALEDLANSVLALGDFAFDTRQAGDTTVRSAIRGSFAMNADAMSGVLAGMLDQGAQRFDDAPFPSYLFAVNPIPAPPQGSAVVGTGLHRSFLLLASENADAERLRHTIAHEIVHEWITRRMGPTDEETDAQRMWFTEGATEYFAWKLQLAAGLIDTQDFLAGMSDLANAYLASPVRELPAGELAERIFESEEAQRLPYQRGALLAWHWDILARERGSSLDAVIADLIDGNERQELTDARIRAAMTRRIGGQFDSDLARYVVQGKALDPMALTLPGCLVAIPERSGTVRFAIADGSSGDTCRAELLGPA